MLTLFLALALALGDDPFEDLDLEAALTRARGEDRILLVEFAAGWSPACKQMRYQTWADPGVYSWIRQHAIAIRVDVDEQVALAASYAVRARPTIVLLHQDGLEFERFEGFWSPQRFLEWSAQVLARERELRQLTEREQSLAESDDVPARYELADDLFRARRYDAALRQYLWLWPASRELDSFRGVRVSFMLADMAELASDHRRSADAFLGLLEEAEARLSQAPGASDYELREWSMLCQYLGEEPRIERWYERHPKERRR